MDKCIFCQIAQGQLLNYPVYEDAEFLAFMDIHPINPGHVVLIPKQHLEYVFELPDDIYQKLFATAKKISGPLRKVMAAKRVALAVEGFAVNHAHVHLVPVNAGNELDPHRAKLGDLNQLKILAAKIKQAVG